MTFWTPFYSLRAFARSAGRGSAFSSLAAFSAVHRYFLEPARRFAWEPWGFGIGLFHVGRKQDARPGRLFFYIPSTPSSTAARPLVVALHGGYGMSGFYLDLDSRGAKSWVFILAPTSEA
jgi:poly(3-hydroxybutyrate) depolymerase